ncbi:hypothetical protein K435DRAFT_664208, partial [Dendrothele bispora CBS 962.96]
QLQALHHSKQACREHLYQDEKTWKVFNMINGLDPILQGADMVYDDIFCGSDYLELAQRIGITEDDFVITQSTDGAQVYQNKKSDTWVGIWIINDYSPTVRKQSTHTSCNCNPWSPSLFGSPA